MRVVTVGTSNITELLIEGFKESNVEVFACVGRDEKRVADFAEKCGVEYHATDYDGVLESKVFDTVYLGLPNSLHYEYAKKALLAGKNVIVEKPFATNLRQAKELINLAASKNLLIFDANITLHNIAYKQLKKDLELLGEIRMVELDYSKYSSKYSAFKNGELPNIFNPNYSGGALMDLGIYNVSFACGLFGLPKKVNYYPNIQRGIDTSGVAILDYNTFKVCSIACKDSNKGSLVNILGEKGNIISYQDNNIFDSYTISLNDGTKFERRFAKVTKYYYEIQDFKKIMMFNNHKLNNAYLTQTLLDIKVLDDLRNSCGLYFKDDRVQ